VDSMSLKDKVAVVTGAGSGIGAAIAHNFAAKGAIVCVLERDVPAGTAVVEEIKSKGGKGECLECDVSDPKQVKAVFARIVETISSPAILVNNAGIAHVGNLQNTTAEDMDRLYAVNVKGVFNCMQAVIDPMLSAGGGVILNLASIASKIGLEDRLAYSMTKGAVLTMTLSVARDYIKQNIRCNCICPARVHTPFVDNFIKQNYPGKEAEVFEKLSQSQPIGRMGKPEEIASLAAFLCSEDAAFITGSAYDIDGGFTLLR